jgi:hypothetical protein
MLIKTPSTTLFHADGQKTATSEQVIMPMRVSVERPTQQGAVTAARSVVEQLAGVVPNFKPKGAMLALADLAAPGKESRSELFLEQQDHDRARLQLAFSLILRIDQGQFWEHAEVIAQAIDFVHGFCSRQKDRTLMVSLDTLLFATESGTDAGQS